MLGALSETTCLFQLPKVYPASKKALYQKKIYVAFVHCNVSNFTLKDYSFYYKLFHKTPFTLEPWAPLVGHECQRPVFSNITNL